MPCAYVAIWRIQFLEQVSMLFTKKKSNTRPNVRDLRRSCTGDSKVSGACVFIANQDTTCFRCIIGHLSVGIQKILHIREEIK